MRILVFSLLILAVLPAMKPVEDPLLEISGKLLSSPALQQLTPRGMGTLLGKDRDAIIGFVRDEVRFEAYGGILRGARGALLARAGNSYDQALLLKEMLDAAGFRTRLARAKLPKREAGLLVESMRPAPDAGGPPLGSADLKHLEIAGERWRAEWERHGRRVAVAVDAAVSAAAKDLKGMDLPAPPDRRERIAETARDYLWVQLLLQDRWLDLHPAFPAGKEPALEPAAVSNYISSLPPHFFHWVRLRLFAERVEGKSLKRILAMDRRVLTAAAAGEGVTFSLRPSAAGEGSVLLRPVVRVGNLAISGGELEAAVGGQAPDGAMTALWLEITILSPGERPRVNTITLADTRARERRVAGSGVSGEEVPPARTLSADELGVSVEMALVSGAVDRRAALRYGVEALRWIIRNTDSDPADLAGRLEGFPSANPLLSHWASLLPIAWSRAFEGRTVYLDAPAVACVLYRPEAEEDAVRLRTSGGIIFLRTSFAGNGEGEAPALPGLVASRLLDEIAKMHRVEPERVDSALAAGTPGGYNLITSSKREEFNGQGWLDGTLAELDDDLLRGAAVVVPSTESAEIWWRIEAGTADPVARGPWGWPLHWEDAGYAGASPSLVPGEVLRAFGAARPAQIGGESPSNTIHLFLRRHLLQPGASPLLPVLAAAPGELPGRLPARLENRQR